MRATGLANDYPGHDEIALIRGGDENSCAQNIIKSGACCMQGNNEIFHRLAGLRLVVSDFCSAAIQIKRVSAGQKDEARLSGSRCRVGILSHIGKLSRTDQNNILGHALTVKESQLAAGLLTNARKPNL